MFDRILLLLLLLLLPLGIVASRFIAGEIKIGSSTSGSIDSAKLDALTAQISQQLQQVKISNKNFNLTGVIYSSQSATLTVGGSVPKAQELVWVWVAGNKSATSVNNASASANQVKYEPVGPMVITPTGTSFSTAIDVEPFKGVIEVRLEQGQAVKTIRYDLTGNKRLDND